MELSLASLDSELWKRYSSAYGDISPGISKLLDASTVQKASTLSMHYI